VVQGFKCSAVQKPAQCKTARGLASGLQKNRDGAYYPEQLENEKGLICSESVNFLNIAQ
jgi:hypothetical protein